jgi:hypothetical protein
MIAVGNLEGVLSITMAMLPYLFKKANEARAVIDYYEGRITGNKLFSLLEREVKAGRRKKRNHTARASVPYTFPDGDAIMKKRRKEKIRSAIARTRAKVVKSDYHSVRREFSRNGLRLVDIGRKYPQYSRETIRRILGCDRGYVLVVGEGLKRGRRCKRKHSNSVSSQRSRFEG